MDLLNRAKNVVNKVVDSAEKTLTESVKAVEAGVEQYNKEGLKSVSHKVGEKLGHTLKEVSENVTQYANEIERSNKKAINPLGISFKKGTLSHTTAKTVVASINTIRFVSQDAAKKLDSFSKTPK